MEIIIKQNEITKIKRTQDATIVFTATKCYICIKDQPLPQPNDYYFILQLKELK